MRRIELSIMHHGLHQTYQLGHFRHVVMFEEHRLLRVESAREEVKRHLKRVLAAFPGVEQRRHRVIIRDEIKRLPFLLKLDGRLHHPEIVSQMQRAGGLYARQNSHGRKLTSSGRRANRKKAARAFCGLTRDARLASLWRIDRMCPLLYNSFRAPFRLLRSWVLVGTVLVAPARLSAQDNYEIQVYGSRTVLAGKTKVELRSNCTP